MYWCVMHLHSSKSQSQKFGLPKIAAVVRKTWKQLGNDEWLQETWLLVTSAC
jgi:hypothetical protein